MLCRLSVRYYSGNVNKQQYNLCKPEVRLTQRCHLGFALGAVFRQNQGSKRHRDDFLRLPAARSGADDLGQLQKCNRAKSFVLFSSSSDLCSPSCLQLRSTVLARPTKSHRTLHISTDMNKNNSYLYYFHKSKDKNRRKV